MLACWYAHPFVKNEGLDNNKGSVGVALLRNTFGDKIGEEVRATLEKMNPDDPCKVCTFTVCAASLPVYLCLHAHCLFILSRPFVSHVGLPMPFEVSEAQLSQLLPLLQMIPFHCFTDAQPD